MVYAFFRIVFFEADPLVPLLKNLSSIYLNLIVDAVSYILKTFSIPIYIDDQTFYSDNSLLFSVTHSFLSRRWTLGVLLFIWLTPSDFYNKLWFSFKAALINFLGNTLQIFIAVNMSISGYDATESKNMGYTVVILGFIVLLIQWIIRNKEIFLKLFSHLGFERDQMIRKFSVLMIFWVLATIIIHFIMSFFPFTPYVNFLFNATHHILNSLGYESYVDSHYLVGDKGNIYMAKYCLGIKTMMIFMVFILMTGMRNIPKLIFISIGLILIHIVNIIRFVLLFIYLQNNEDYTLAMDQHDIYNYFVYGFIFILWIIWLEKYSDIWHYRKSLPATK